VQKYIKRKEEFDQKQKDDLSVFKATSKERKELFKQSQKARDAEFKSILDRNVQPPKRLWAN
jgi:hypothetical protein